MSDDVSLDIEKSAATFDDFEGYTQVRSGRKMWKTVDDLQRYTRVLRLTRPAVVVETGTRWAGFSEWMHVSFGVDVITVDIQRIQGWDIPEGVTSILGDSKDPVIVDRVRELVAGRRTMVVLDSDHHAPHVAAEIRAYSPMVTPGCYLVVEDGLADLSTVEVARRIGNHIPETGGPLRAVRQEMAGRPGWVRDVEIENLTEVSHHPMGWWLRAEVAVRPEDPDA